MNQAGKSLYPCESMDPVRQLFRWGGIRRSVSTLANPVDHVHFLTLFDVAESEDRCRHWLIQWMTCTH